MQPTLCIGLTGHVSHGKSTLVAALTGVKTQKFKKELEQNITIELGYANANIFSCPKCPSPEKFQSCSSSILNPKCKKCQYPEMKFERQVSLIDCPGHSSYLATMLNGAATMDAAFLIISANDPCPQPQTLEHLMILDGLGMKHIVIIQNKIDLVTLPQAALQVDQIHEMIRGTVAENARIIPISAQVGEGINLDVLCQELLKIPIPIPMVDAPLRMKIIRSFDVNKPGAIGDQLKGGVLGGTIVQGTLQIGQEIEILPGLLVLSSSSSSSETSSGVDIHDNDKKHRNPKYTIHPIRTRVMSLFSEKIKLESAVSGGLIGVCTEIDPYLTRSNRLVGQLVGKVGTLPPIQLELEIQFRLLKRIENPKNPKNPKNPEKDVKSNKVSSLQIKEKLQLIIGASITMGTIVEKVSKQVIRLELETPICVDKDEKISLFRSMDKKWKLIGDATITRFIPYQQQSPFYDDDAGDDDDDIKNSQNKLESVAESVVNLEEKDEKDEKKSTSDKTKRKKNKTKKAKTKAKAKGKEKENKDDMQEKNLPMYFMYPDQIPKEGEIVMVQVNQITEYGAMVNLLEYNYMMGLIQFVDISRSRIPHVRTVIKEGQTFPAEISHLDQQQHQGEKNENENEKEKEPKKIHIDLSRKSVQVEGAKNCRTRFQQGKRLLTVMQRLVSLSEENLTLSLLYQWIWSWGLHSFSHVMTKLSDPETTYDFSFFASSTSKSQIALQTMEDHFLLLVKQHFHLKNKLHMKTDIQLTCLKKRGIRAIRDAISLAHTLDSNLKIYLQGSPIYTLTLENHDYNFLKNHMEDILTQMKHSIMADGGEFKIISPPTLSDESLFNCLSLDLADKDVSTSVIAD